MSDKQLKQNETRGSNHDDHGKGHGGCSHDHSHQHDHDHKDGCGHAHHAANDNEQTCSHGHKHHHNTDHDHSYGHGHSCGHDHHHDHEGGCGHDHHDHDHHNHHEEQQEISYNNGILKAAFSKVSGRVGNWLNKHRKKIVLGAAAATAVIDYALTNSTMGSSLALLIAGAAIAHDSSEDIMETTGELKKTQNLSSGVVGTAVGATHTLAEGIFSLSASVQGNSDMAVASVMGSNASHILLMAGGAAVIGSVGKGQSTTWKLHAAGIAGLTGAFGYQIATGEFNPYLGAAMVGGGLYYLWNRVKTGETCAVHGDACGGHDHSDHNHDHEPLEPVTWKTRLTDPKLLQLGGSVAALTAGAHVAGHQIITQATNWGVTATVAGAGVAALAWALPELVLTWKAAHKGDREMAWGAVTGCTVATVGIVGGLMAMSGVPVPLNLDPFTTQEGLLHMGAFAGSAAAIVAATHPKVIEKISKDGSSLPKWLGGAFLAAAMGYYTSSAMTSCHFDFVNGELVEHCIGIGEDYEPLDGATDPRIDGILEGFEL